MIFFTNRFIPKGFAGATRGLLIFIRPTYRDDKGLLEHEKVHRRQWLRTLGLHSLLYLFVPDYKFRAEVEAYREQLKHYPDDRSQLFARYIANDYGLSVTEQEALDALLA
jgi:hypothetical protein